MPLWEKISYTFFILAMIYFLYPGLLGALDRSKQAEDKHWGTVLVIAAVLVVLVLFLVSAMQ